MNRIKYILFPTVILLTIACGGPAEDTSTPSLTDNELSGNEVALTPSQAAMAGILIDTIRMVEVPVERQLNGLADVPPEKRITIAPPVGGFVRQMNVLEGMQVKKGQLLISLEDQGFIQLQEEYLSRLQQLKLDEANYHRQKALFEEQINARKALEQASAAYEAGKMVIEGMRSRLRMMNVDITTLESGKITNTYNMYAPIDGFVTKVSSNKGKYVSSAEPVLELVDLNAVYAVINVFEKDIPQIHLQQNVTIILSDGVTKVPAHVKYIGKAIQDDRSVSVICEFTEKNSKVIPGMYLTAFVELSRQVMPGLPAEAVATYQGRKYVFVPSVKPDIYTAIEVKSHASATGIATLENNQSLPAGTPVVIKGAYDLLGKWRNTEDN